MDPGKYQWRLLVRTASGYHETPYKTFVVLPPAPLLSKPENNKYATTAMPTLEWNSVNGAAKYIIQVDVNAKFNSSSLKHKGYFQRIFVIHCFLIVIALRKPNTFSVN